MRQLYTLLTLLLILFIATAAIAAQRPITGSRPDMVDKPDTPTAEAPSDQIDEIPASLVKTYAQPVPERELSPMMVEIKMLLDTEKQAVEERRVQMTQTTDMTQRVILIDEIHQLKIDTELEILRVQLRYAQQEGRLDTVAEIENAIDFMTNPRPVPAPEPRPVPEAARR